MVRLVSYRPWHPAWSGIEFAPAATRPYAAGEMDVPDVVSPPPGARERSRSGRRRLALAVVGLAGAACAPWRSAGDAVPAGIKGPFSVVLDAGHGGRDPGATSPVAPVIEKEVALRVALLTGAALQRQRVGVVYTRQDDRFIPLAARAALAGRSGASLLLSVHVNAASDPAVRGAEAWHRPGGAGAALASATLAGLAPVLQGHDLTVRGTRDGSHLAVLRASVPAVLVELGYLTNRQEARLLTRPAYLEELARGLVAGVTRYRDGAA